jgi:hypothetical protein
MSVLVLSWQLLAKRGCVQLIVQTLRVRGKARGLPLKSLIAQLVRPSLEGSGRMPARFDHRGRFEAMRKQTYAWTVQQVRFFEVATRQAARSGSIAMSS